MPTTDELAKIIWNYMLLGDTVRPTDIILCFGSQNLAVANHAINLYQKGMAPKVLFSGGLGRVTKNELDQPEADLMAKCALAAGIPSRDILIENKSTNTGDNILFSYRLLKAKRILPKSLTLVHKPYMERRIKATFDKFWPEPRPVCIVSSEPISFGAYCQQRSKDAVINSMVGDLERIREYPKLGYQTAQEIPDKVWSAFTELVKRGYDKQLINK